jgi:hypothetical protein
VSAPRKKPAAERKRAKAVPPEVEALTPVTPGKTWVPTTEADHAWIEETRQALDEFSATHPVGRELPPLSEKYARHPTCATVGVRVVRGGRS